MEVIDSLRRPKDLATFFRRWRRYNASGQPKVSWTAAFADFDRWRSYRKRQSTALDDGQPWMAFSAIRFLESNIQDGTRVFEWGMGGSTSFLLGLGAVVVSVEHDIQWYEKVRAQIGQHSRWTPLLHQPEPSTRCGSACDWMSYASSDADHAGEKFESYATCIDDYPDDSFDIIIVDGRARPSCARHALLKLATGGHLLWDDTDREHYAPAMEAIDDDCFERFELAGPGTYLSHFLRSTAWIKTATEQ